MGSVSDQDVTPARYLCDTRSGAPDPEAVRSFFLAHRSAFLGLPPSGKGQAPRLVPFRLFVPTVSVHSTRTIATGQPAQIRPIKLERY